MNAQVVEIIDSCNSAFDKVSSVSVEPIKKILEKLDGYSQDQKISMLVAMVKSDEYKDILLIAMAAISVVLGENTLEPKLEPKTEDLYPEYFVEIKDLKKYSNKVSHYSARKIEDGKILTKKFKTAFTAQCWVGHPSKGIVYRHFHKQYVLTGELQNGVEVIHKSVNPKRLEKIAIKRRLENTKIEVKL